MTRLSQVGGRDGLGLDKAHLAWRGEDCGWSIREDGHDSPIVHVMVAGMDSATGHGAPHRGEVRTASGLPAKVGTTRRHARMWRPGWTRPLVASHLVVKR
ncbi:hypothetical protein CDL15_Pgr020657 [Punica granatum]|uniref:Uncharacterized protein n=1 Tax=Punica granatum TaxID=22663 RepID=A0A218VSX8_PUNGR|nr:hypothetical protein CDL15_Pgr020657 [Punica granatum]